ncbi:MAG: hypothetical protein EA363_01455, partial [Balneolaceae bacterium]
MNLITNIRCRLNDHIPGSKQSWINLTLHQGNMAAESPKTDTLHNLKIKKYRGYSIRNRIRDPVRNLFFGGIVWSRVDAAGCLFIVGIGWSRVDASSGGWSPDAPVVLLEPGLRLAAIALAALFFHICLFSETSVLSTGISD